MKKNIILKTTCLIALLFAAQYLSAQTLSDAIRLSENEAYEKAEKAFNTVITADGSNADAYYYQGQNYLRLEKNVEAKAAFDKGISLNPNSALNYVGLGRLAWLNNDTAKARENFTKAKTIISDKAVKKSDKTKVLCEIAETYIYSPTKDLVAADAVLVDAERLDPLNTDVYLLEGDVLLEKDPTNGSGPIAKYNKALELNPRLAKAIIRKGKLYKRAGNPQLALDNYKAAEAIDSSFAPAYREKAELFFLAGKKALAISNYEKYLELNSDCSAQRRYAYFLYDSKLFTEALVQLNKVQSTCGDWSYTNRLTGYCLIETGDYIKGVASLEKSLANKDLKSIMLDYKYIGQAYAKTGNDSMGVYFLGEALKVDVGNTDILSDMASAYYKQKKYSDVILVLSNKKSLGKDLSSTEYMNLGNSYKNLKRYIDADSAYMKVIEKSPSFANAYLNRAIVNLAMDTMVPSQYLAKPHFENYLTKVDMADLKAKNGLMNALEYLGGEAWKNTKDFVKAKEYYTKLQTLDAENAAAKAFYSSAAGK
jgi:tetratricopeptide (TPR) repeat protein